MKRLVVVGMSAALLMVGVTLVGRYSDLTSFVAGALLIGVSFGVFDSATRMRP